MSQVYTIKVLGNLWQPGFTGASALTFIHSMAPFDQYPNTLEGVIRCARERIGDFSSIIDFEVTLTTTECYEAGGWDYTRTKSEVVKPWEDEDNEAEWQVTMDPVEEYS